MRRDEQVRVGRSWERVLGRSFVVPVATDLPKLTLGSAYGAHCVSPDGLDRTSVVYSCGIGEDISFDQAMIRTFGVTVHGFDPTPRALEFVERMGSPMGLVVHPYALGRRDGTALFHPPANPAHVSHSLSGPSTSAAPAIEVEVRRLSTVMKELGHSHLDVLKLDIEGEEYAVIEELLGDRLEVRQLLVEFHHQLRGIGLDRTRDSVVSLRRAGYRVFDISPSHREFSFIR